MGTWAGPTQTSCVPCGVEDCTTCSDTRVEGGVCFLAPLTGVSTTPFNYYAQYLTSSIELCKVLLFIPIPLSIPLYPHSHSTILIPIPLSSFPYHYPHSHTIPIQNGNGTACQVVINLCVLQGYSRSDPACEAATTLLSLK